MALIQVLVLAGRQKFKLFFHAGYVGNESGQVVKYVEIPFSSVTFHHSAFFEQVLLIGTASDVAFEYFYPLEFAKATTIRISCGLGIAERFQNGIRICNKFLEKQARRIYVGY